jgi:hypothetical protein
MPAQYQLRLTDTSIIVVDIQKKEKVIVGSVESVR